MNSTFPKREKFCPKIEFYLCQTKMKANVCGHSTFQVNRTKNATGKQRLTSSNWAVMSVLRAKNDTRNPFQLLGELTENSQALQCTFLLRSCKETIYTFNGSI